VLAGAASYGILAGAALVAGAMNAMAGGGSFLSFPALLGVHVPPVNANATNTVALWPGQMASIVAFRAELRAGRKLLVPVMIAGAIGGLGGALLLLHTAQTTFQTMVPWLLLFATLVFAASGPLNRRLLKNLTTQTETAEKPVFPVFMFAWLVAVSLYIGYFGAGAGFLIITVLTLFGVKNLNEVNALKALCTTLANGVAVITFVAAGAVYWKECLTMMSMAVVGGYVGAAYSRKMNPKILRGAVIVTGAVLSAFFFYQRYYQRR
jgi:uncharacterized membrane protein YfcA